MSQSSNQVHNLVSFSSNRKSETASQPRMSQMVTADLSSPPQSPLTCNIDEHVVFWHKNCTQLK